MKVIQYGQCNVITVLLSPLLFVCLFKQLDFQGNWEQGTLAVIVDHLKTKTKKNDVFALEKTHRTVFSL